tara:strand:- start:17602 stop:18483 length:882 start_codon:yes stop_codon:yes gene_type:complete
MNILITGGTGFIGSALTKALVNRGDSVCILSRNKSKVMQGIESFENISEINKNTDLDAIINLAGAPIDKRWTQSYKKKLLGSRITTTQNIITLIKKLKNKPKILISASAIGYYGNQGDVIIDEDAEPNDEFTHKLCQQWESEARKAELEGVNVCITRLGVVLGKDNGALKKMLPAFKMAIGGRLGSGQQYFSWVHIDDVISAFLFLLENNKNSTYNLSAPNPVTNSTFTKSLGKQLNRPTILPMPGFIIRILFGEMGQKLLLNGQRVIPQKLQDEGFNFKYPVIESALKDILK